MWLSDGCSLILGTLEGGQTKSFDLLLPIMEEHGNVDLELANQMTKELSQPGMPTILYSMRSCVVFLYSIRNPRAIKMLYFMKD